LRAIAGTVATSVDKYPCESKHASVCCTVLQACVVRPLSVRAQPRLLHATGAGARLVTTIQGPEALVQPLNLRLGHCSAMQSGQAGLRLRGLRHTRTLGPARFPPQWSLSSSTSYCVSPKLKACSMSLVSAISRRTPAVPWPGTTHLTHARLTGAGASAPDLLRSMPAVQARETALDLGQASLL